MAKNTKVANVDNHYAAKPADSTPHANAVSDLYKEQINAEGNSCLSDSSYVRQAVFSVEQDKSENEACRLANDKGAGRGAEKHRPHTCGVLEDESSVEKQATDAEDENTPISVNGSDSSQSSSQDELTSVLTRRSVTSCPSSTSALLDASNEDSIFQLWPEDMGEDLIGRIAAFRDNPLYSGKVRIHHLPQVDWQRIVEINQPQPDEHYWTIRFAEGGRGYSHLHIDGKKKLNFRGLFGRVGKKPSQREAENFVDSLAITPPKGTISYIVGPAMATRLSNFLHPGPYLANLQHLPGINSTYDHIGEPNSGTAWHKEDANLRSCNITHFGYKIWLLLPVAESKRFEDFVSKNWKVSYRCDQFVRHLNLFIGPARLKEEGFNVSVNVTGPGDMFDTLPGQYHCVANMTTCAASSSNILLSGETLNFEGIKLCEQCGLYPLTEQPTQTHSLKRQRHAADNSTKRPRRVPTDKEGVRQIMKRAVEIDANCSIPDVSELHQLSPAVLLLACGVRSREAVRYFASLVSARRDLSGRGIYPNDAAGYMKFLCQSLKRSNENSALNAFLYRYIKCLINDEVERRKQGRFRMTRQTDLEWIEDVIGDLGCSRATFHRYCDQGSGWRKLCGPYIGLLCFIPTYSTSFGGESDYLGLEEVDRKTFHPMLSDAYGTAIFAAGEAFIQSLYTGTNDIEFSWENVMGISELEKLSEGEMLSSLSPVTGQSSCRVGADWHIPTNWPQSRPFSPMNLLNTDGSACDLCDESACGCTGMAEARPRIRRYGNRLGLQAVAIQPSEMAHARGDMIGHVTGEIIPPNTDLEAADFFHPELKEVTCQINCKQTGNLFRLLYRGHNPNAKIMPSKVAGKYVMAIKAIRDIADQEEITL
ncbi:unnamed protein product [Clonostachys rosea f. rosea IK726]|uniref:Uncharacterized protein n=1 Tax=Clonostachys rosea f. rosea IK726 TaxID=1349383 RepID=A0ACA9U6S0_BIOOC|nr:unnamed protein product [Clonostachys rosea f. rosea IK726]